MLTQDRLKYLLTYNTINGNFVRNIRVCNQHKGTTAGALTPYGYITIAIDGKHYQAHCLAFLYMEGSFPINDAEHKDTNRANNAWSNLRHATRLENMQNITKAYSNKKYSKLLGAYFDKAVGNWKAGICVNYKMKWLGRFPTDILAHEAYLKAKQELHPFSTIGVK